MTISSYNETKNQQIELRHIFFPPAYGFVSEAIIGILALVLFNVSTLSNRLLSQNFGTADPLSLWSQIVRQVLDKAGQHNIVQQVFLFSLWAIVGALIYIGVFRIIQISLGVRHSVGLGVSYVRQDPDKGIFRWLSSLHDLFIKMLLIILGVAIVTSGAVVCFGIASQELNNALSESFPKNAGLLAISLLAAVLSVRVIVLGISLLSPRFRNWYTA